MPAATSPAVLATVADPTRARIIRLILDSAEGRVSVTELAGELGLRQPTVSHHMRALASAGVVERRQEGRRAWFSLAPDRVDEVIGLVGHAPAAGPDLERIAADLTERYQGVHGAETVSLFVRTSHELLRRQERTPARLASRVSALAVERLDALTRSRSVDRGAPEVLFVCVRNAGRSQLAAAILRHLAGDRVRARTAGSEPAEEVKAHVVAVLDEIGVPLGDEFPKPLTAEALRAADVVVTMGCGDACPVLPGKTYLDWPLDDPADQPLPRVRAIRDEIERRVRGLLGDLLPIT
ncbi:metalloregulator ArsR/SmtB family transcription factor [Microbacterium sp. KNMS]